MADFSLVTIGGGAITSPIHIPEIYLRRAAANQLFVNASGDQMQGDLDMKNHKIINLKTPEKPGDAASKTYVDTHAAGIKTLLNTKVVGTVQQILTKVSQNSKNITDTFEKAFKHSTDLKKYITITLKAVDLKLRILRGEFSTLRSATEENSKKISELGRRILLTPKLQIFETKLTSASHVSHLVLRPKGTVAILQILIEVTPDVWFDIFSLSPTYQFRLYNKDNKIFITHMSSLPKTWTKKIKIFSLKIIP